MRYYLLVFILFSFSNNLFAQLPSEHVPEEVMALLLDADACEQNASADCEHIYISFLNKAKEYEQDDFLDYVYYHMGRYYYVIGMQEKAISMINKGIRYARRDDDSIMVAALLTSAGSVQFMKGNIDSAMIYFIEGADIQEKIGDSIYAAYTYLNMGAALSGVRNFQESNKYFKKSYAILNEKRIVEHLGTVAGNIGLQYYNLKEKDSAMSWAKLSLDIADSTDEILSKILANYLISAIYNDDQQYETALTYATEAISLARNSNHRNYLGEALNVYAFALNQLGRSQQAAIAIEEAVEIQSSLNNLFGLTMSYKTAAEVFFNVSKFEQSADYYNRFTKMNDSLLGQKNIYLVNQLNRKYETEKKERQIVQNQLIIEKRNAQLSQTRFGVILTVLVIICLLIYTLYYRRTQKIKRIRREQEYEKNVLKAWMNGEERERNRISQELHDGVASMIGAANLNLNAFHYLTEKQKEEQVNKVDAILKETHTEIRRIAHNLLPLVLEEKGILEAVRQFAENLNQTGQMNFQVQTNKDVEQLIIPSHIGIILYRIIQELINNVMKHSEACNAELRFEIKDGNLIISLKDDGKGFDEEKNNYHQGIYSIHERIKSLEGYFSLSSELNKGTSATIMLDINKFSQKS